MYIFTEELHILFFYLFLLPVYIIIIKHDYLFQKKNKLVCNSRNIDEEIKAIQEKLESLQMDIEHNQYLISRNELIINNVSFAQKVKSNNDKPIY